mmetsp:Transcript_58275/g.67226  ORF Transcript_58275/g.67226 Transcript_58275/m.67226 type:complete len:204 (-) Transcript_58275:56-667(-)
MTPKRRSTWTTARCTRTRSPMRWSPSPRRSVCIRQPRHPAANNRIAYGLCPSNHRESAFEIWDGMRHIINATLGENTTCFHVGDGTMWRQTHVGRRIFSYLTCEFIVPDPTEVKKSQKFQISSTENKQTINQTTSPKKQKQNLKSERYQNSEFQKKKKQNTHTQNATATTFPRGTYTHNQATSTRIYLLSFLLHHRSFQRDQT